MFDDLFYSNLNKRTQSENMNAYNLTLNSIFSGAPKSPILGRLLFLIYINSPHHAIKH